MTYNSDRPLLDARLEGIIFATATANSTTTETYSFTGDREFNGVEMYAWDSNPGDYLNFITEYYTGTEWKRFKKFGKKWYVMPNTLHRVILFPNFTQNGVRIKVEYVNVDASNDVKFVMNLFKFIDEQTVDTSIGEEGEDW